MEDNGISPIVLQEIKEIVKKNDVQKVILFGSRARGNYHRASDIDLAVKGKDVLGFTFDVKEKTSTLLDFDVVNLADDLQDSFRQQIMKEGVLLYEEI